MSEQRCSSPSDVGNFVGRRLRCHIPPAASVVPDLLSPSVQPNLKIDNLRQSADLPQSTSVVNVLEQYRSAGEHDVLVTPCLVLVEPPPRVVVVATLRDLPTVRAALRLPLRPDGRHG